MNFLPARSSQRSAFDQSRLAVEFTPKYVAQETLGKYTAHHVELAAKEGSDVAYSVVQLWIDSATGNVGVIQEVDLSTLDDSIFTKAWLESKSR